ncbi:hypothetical protein V2G26_007276 [Clonostachys chloroleuca]
MATPSFLQLLEYTGLLAYQDRLHDNGLDDVDALCDMTKDDLAKLSITAFQWETLDKIFSGIRSIRATTLPSAGHLSTDQGLISPVFVPTALDQDPDIIASNQMSERSLPLGSEVVVCFDMDEPDEGEWLHPAPTFLILLLGIPHLCFS